MPDPIPTSSERVRAAEDRVASLPVRSLAYLGGLAAIALTVWMFFALAGTPLPPELRAACERVIRDRSVRPLLDATLRPADGPKAPATGFGLITPVGTTVRRPEPELRWRPLPGATEYRVVLIRSSDGVRIESPELPRDQHIWRPPALLAGVMHRWEVQAWKNGELLRTSPSAGAPEARFRVLELPVVAALEEVERAHPRDPFVLGVARARAGLRAEARLAFETMRADPKQAELSAKLCAELE